jgi:diguanylate cyclase (GGDEF)-like protein
MISAIQRVRFLTYSALGNSTLALSVGLAAIYTGITFFIQDSPDIRWIGELLVTLANLFSALPIGLACVAMGRKSRRQALAWGLLGAGVLALALGGVIRISTMQDVGEKIYLSIGDITRLMFYTCYLAGIILWLVGSRGPWNWNREILDGAMTALAALMGYQGLIFLAPSKALASQAVLPGIFLVVDALALWMIFLPLYRQPEPTGDGIGFFAVSALVLMLADILVILRLIDVAQVSYQQLQVMWLMSVCFLGAAGVVRLNSATSVGSVKKALFPLELPMLSAAGSTLPPLLAIVSLILLLSQSADESSRDYWLLALLTGLVLLIVLLRQVLAFNDNQRRNDSLGRAIVGLQNELEAQRQMNRELQVQLSQQTIVQEHLSHALMHDSLTNLPNRAMLFVWLNQALANARIAPDFSQALLIIRFCSELPAAERRAPDLVDKLQVALAGLLRGWLRAGDLVARLENNEFAVVLAPGGGATGAARAAQRILDGIQQPVEVYGQAYPVWAAIGIVEALSGYQSPEQVVRDASFALSQAISAENSGYQFFHDQLREPIVELMKSANELGQALRHGEVALIFQPVIDLQSQELAGFEGLVRWDHPRRGLLLPGEILNLAEDGGLSHTLSEWTLEYGLQELRRWRANHLSDPPLSLRLNVSDIQFLHTGFPTQVLAQLERTSLAPDSLVIEVTERIFKSELAGVKETLSELANLGVVCHLDDFGTGATSLKSLQEFGIKTVKIDGSLVAPLRADFAPELLRAILAMARELRLTCIAEGVESQDQLDALRKLGCQFGQGYWLGRPRAGIA